jgi:ribosomal-protein-alanine N-acetyltransferase
VIYYLEPMRQEDVSEVSEVDRLCFTNPWPQSAYRRELRKPQNNYYVVLRHRRGPRGTRALLVHPDPAALAQ